MIKFQNIKNFFSTPNNVHCRIEMPRRLKKSELGKSIIEETNKVFSELSQENIRSYFTVSLKKSGTKNLQCRLIDENIMPTELIETIENVESISTKSPEEIKNYAKFIANEARDSYFVLRQDIDTEKVIISGL